MKNQKQTAAQAYRALRRQNLQIAAERVMLPSGIEFELKRVDLQVYIRAGRLPDSLLRRGIAGWERLAKLAADNPEEISERDARDAMETVIFMREVVTEACVNPRLVIGATEADELDPADLTEEDFNFIFAWATGQIETQGGPAESLAKFRR